ncbi:MAG: peptidase M64 [Bacteroidetes bacterium]|nr:MAG: peptidase M64 [Bacteroidota bacterium]
MKRIVFIVFGLFLFANLSAQNFEKYFTKGGLRVDYYHGGNSEVEYISNDAMYHEPFFGGSHINLIDTFNYGHYKYEVFDSLTNKLIYSRGYSTLFGEWRFTEEAKSNSRTLSESVIMPFPKASIKLVFYKRKKDMTWEVLYSRYINPNDYNIIPQQKNRIEAKKVHYSGDPATKVDIVLLAEGYSADEQDKFMKDAERFTDYLLSWAPFNEMKDRFNIWVVPVVSLESGTDIPGTNVWKNTAFDSHFYTFGTERYINTVNNKAVRDAAANAPYDQIYILANTSKYGGAGIFNFYSICTSDNPKSGFVFCHEFGHAFGGLADEYTGDASVEDFYDLNYEPWEPNITTLTDFSKKWKSMVEKGTPIPTPDTRENVNVLGAFEGAGYVTKGVYRPKHDCSMKSIRDDDFCPVCVKALIDMVNFVAH